MTVTLKFELPEDNEDFEMAIKYHEFYIVIWEYLDWLRSELKYSTNRKEEDVKVLEECREKLFEIIKDRDVSSFF